jgi:hypothetical protein
VARHRRQYVDVVHERHDRLVICRSRNIPTNWTVVATANFNSDGFGDILWRDTSGNLAMWLMNGVSVASSAGVGDAPSTWSVVATGDYDDGDGKSDLLWRDTSGNTALCSASTCRKRFLRPRTS